MSEIVRMENSAPSGHRAVVAFPSINELDNADRALQWLLKGKIDSRHMIEELPHTSQDLRDGIVSPEDLYDCLKRKLNTSLTYPDEEGIHRTRFEALARHLAKDVLPSTWCRNPEQLEWLQKAHVEIAEDIYKQSEAVEQKSLHKAMMLWS